MLRRMARLSRNPTQSELNFCDGSAIQSPGRFAFESKESTVGLTGNST
jgi:hypothetical protein